MKRAFHAMRRRLAMLLASVELNRFDKQAGGTVKRRSRWSRLLIPAGNVYLRWIGSCSEILSDKDWPAWEQAVAQATGRTASADSDSFAATLHEMLEDSNWTTDHKLQAVELALGELLELQDCRILCSDGSSRPWSHGDATTENVCVDLTRGTARWFDFDMRHRLEVSAVDRHADDLRALVFSAAVSLEPRHYRELAERFVAAIESPALLTRLRQRLAGAWQRADTFQLAQAPLSLENYQRFRACLLETISSHAEGAKEP